MKSSKLWSLVKSGRLLPIHKELEKDGKPALFVVGFRRKSTSRKSRQEIYLKDPIEVAPSESSNAPDSQDS